MASNTEAVDPRELQALQHYLAEYGQQAEVFTQQLQLLEEGRMEALAAIEALRAMVEENDLVLLQIGGGASVRARLVDPEKILVNIGSDVIVEKSTPDAIEFLKDRITEMEASGKKVVETIDRIRNQMNDITRRIEQAYQQSQGPLQ
ncbi:MAG: prefoldin subunit alpha [Methanoregulaceae archaeon]|nr:prefoldin subunit alpha [Methanoregulaceae archaeon]